jgi:glycosyltransferase involved in cell wall biosynthesis
MTEGRIGALHAVTVSLSLTLLRGQLKYLKAAGFHPAALCSPGPQVQDMSARESVPVFTIAMEREVSIIRDIVSLVRIWRLLCRARPLVCNAGTPKAGLLVGLAAWLIRTPCRVYTLRGLRLETEKGAKRAFLRLTERLACACAHRVVCVSPSLRQRAVELGLVRAEKTLVLGSGSSNGVDVSRFTPTPERFKAAAEIRQQLGIDSAIPVIGYVGRLTRDKGLPELLAAFRPVRESFPDAVLMLIGEYEQGDPVPQETRAAIENSPGIVRLGFPGDISLYYLIMDILVLPTHREGFPNTVLEAQAAERPVLTTYATGAIDSISPGVTGSLVPIADPRALAAELIRLLSDRELLEHMGKAGRERVCREFRQEVIWESLARLYSELLQKCGLPVPSSCTFASMPICTEKQ